MIRNLFIDVDTGEDVYEKLLNKRISVQPELKKLTEHRSEDFGVKDLLDKEIEIDWGMSGLWYYEGLKYMLPLGKNFKVYLFPGRSWGVYIYELIPSPDMQIFEMELYKNRKDKDLTVTFEECVKYFDGINESSSDSNLTLEEYKKEWYENYKREIDDRSAINNMLGTKYHGVFWRLKPGFQANLLYKCIKAECIDKKNDIWKFHLKKNLNTKKNLTFTG